MTRRWLYASFLTLFFGLGLHPWTSCALEKPETTLKSDAVTTQLGKKINLSSRFVDDKGEEKPLLDYFGKGHPIVIVPVYYDCPRVCGLILTAMVKLLNELPLTLGKDFKVVTFSFDPEETPSLAAKRAAKFRAQYRIPKDAEVGWEFLVGKEPSIQALLSDIGFKVTPDQGEFAHSAAIMVLTPEGEISQYFTDINFPAWDVKLSLVEASSGKIGSPFDHFLLYCFRFDPTKGKYTWAASLALKGGTVAIALSLALFLVWYIRREPKKI
jgi:protein SCO1